ncbi:MAG: hypothetical protein IJQ21_07770 [Lachnospiraceae bacterium]|nr:hypothetical protein [Lachnospiraceae bacterium]
MKKHLFFTGEKGIGKSTLVKNILCRCAQPYHGFFTVRMNGIIAESLSVHLLRVLNGTAEAPSEENLLFLCGQHTLRDPSRFDLLGCDALCDIPIAPPNVARIVMDELGPNEGEAHDFQESVRSVLDHPSTSVIGVFQKAPSPFLDEIASRKDVVLLTVTSENRDSLAKSEAVIRWMTHN